MLLYTKICVTVNLNYKIHLVRYSTNYKHMVTRATPPPHPPQLMSCANVRLHSHNILAPPRSWRRTNPSTDPYQTLNSKYWGGVACPRTLPHRHVMQ